MKRWKVKRDRRRSERERDGRREDRHMALLVAYVQLPKYILSFSLLARLFCCHTMTP